MFCITLDNNHYQKIKDFGYYPVGLGPKIKNENFLRDNTGHNITKKNPYYGEYSFHFWLWKNNSLDLKNDWIGFCQYRKFWVINEKNEKIINLNQLSQNLIKNIPKNYENYESLLIYLYLHRTHHLHMSGGKGRLEYIFRLVLYAPPSKYLPLYLQIQFPSVFHQNDLKFEFFLLGLILKKNQNQLFYNYENIVL